MIFVRRLLIELAGAKHIAIEEGEFTEKNFRTLTGTNVNGDEKYFVLIVDCHGDETVKSAIIEERPKLVKAKYELILGLRDLYPLPLAELNRLEKGMRYGLPTRGQ